MSDFGSMHLKLRTALDGIVEDTILHIHFRLHTEDAYALLMDIYHFLNRRKRKAHHADEQEHAACSYARPGDIRQIIPDAPQEHTKQDKACSTRKKFELSHIASSPVFDSTLQKLPCIRK